MKSIFEPFESKNSSVQETGLGLSVSYGIIKNHGGNIEVESEAGMGTTFIISIPNREQLK
jgi:two-component system, NtrC family, sensor kinase